MKKFEKFMNIVMKVFGAWFILDAILVLFGVYMPNKWGVGFVYLAFGLFNLFAKYSAPDEFKTK